jgi:hypothetical protein
MTDQLKSCPFCESVPVESSYYDESLWSHTIVSWLRLHILIAILNSPNARGKMKCLTGKKGRSDEMS